MRMKKSALLLIFSLLLTSCSSQEEVVAPELPSVPSNCADTKVLESILPRISDAKYIETEWEPTEGTDLYAAYNAGGIACTYGLQEAEVGATILWAPDNKTLFSELTPNWIEFGQKEIDLPGIDEEAAYYLSEGIQGQGEYHIWSINLLISGSWIQVGATFFSSLEDALPVIKAAIDSLKKPEQAEAKKITGCYLAELPEDLYVFNVHYHDNNTISADFYYKNINGEPTKGLFLGTYTNGIARGFYSLPTSDGTIERELFLKGDRSGFVVLNAKLEKVEGIEKYVRPLNLSWSEDIKYIPAEDCEALLRG
ncbi:MAG: hypothetical protein EBV22_02900 [Actinobacteria bacterium]|nr:hypothetical protein [Actinomycetota bacterium]